MVLVFMFSASWRLTVVTFVMIPLVLVVCKVGGGVWVEGQGAKPTAQTAETAHTMACRTHPPQPPRVGVAVLFCCALPPVRSAQGLPVFGAAAATCRDGTPNHSTFPSPPTHPTHRTAAVWRLLPQAQQEGADRAGRGQQRGRRGAVIHDHRQGARRRGLHAGGLRRQAAPLPPAAAQVGPG